ncbi:hypothetical protein V6R21_23710 [Limibacter armeniacum]|uniref:hypothetical protein n=1 Tax=Limibacter armeniacum TaxID=466084 RepID=UPI002FE5889C
MNLEELYRLEKLDRDYLLTGGNSEEADLIFDQDEFELLEAMYGQKILQPVTINSVAFSEKDLSVLKEFVAPFNFEEGVDLEKVKVPSSLSGEQAEFVGSMLEKLQEVEEVWEYEDKERWEFDEAVSSVGVLFMMNEIDRDFGDEEEEDGTILNDDEYTFLEAIYNETPLSFGGTFGTVSFSEEELDYVRVVLSESELMHEVELSKKQEDFIEGILKKCHKMNEEEENGTVLNVFTLRELYEMDLEDHRIGAASLRFSKDQLKLMDAVFSETKPAKIQLGGLRFFNDQLEYLNKVFEGEETWSPQTSSVSFNKSQRQFVEQVLKVHEAQFAENAAIAEEEEDDDFMPLDIEVLFMMDELEREEMKAIGEKDGDYLFNDEQFKLLKAVFSVNRPNKDIEVGLTGPLFTAEQIDYLNALFKFDEYRQQQYSGEPLSEEQTRFVVGIFERVKDLDENAPFSSDGKI